MSGRNKILYWIFHTVEKRKSDSWQHWILTHSGRWSWIVSLIYASISRKNACSWKKPIFFPGNQLLEEHLIFRLYIISMLNWEPLYFLRVFSKSNLSVFLTAISLYLDKRLLRENTITNSFLVPLKIPC